MQRVVPVVVLALAVVATNVAVLSADTTRVSPTAAAVLEQRFCLCPQNLKKNVSHCCDLILHTGQGDAVLRAPLPGQHSLGQQSAGAELRRAAKRDGHRVHSVRKIQGKLKSPVQRGRRLVL